MTRVGASECGQRASFQFFASAPQPYGTYPRKSESNKAKHGIDFIEAQTLWRSKHVVLGAKDALEKRYMVIGKIGREHWSAIISYRGVRIRIISVRRSTAAEIETYAKIAE